MNQSLPINYTPQLQNLMQNANISSYRELSQKAGVSELQLIRLRRGLASRMRVDILLKISQALGITLTELLTNFAPELIKKSPETSTSVREQEYNNLQKELDQQKQFLRQAFQQSSLVTIRYTGYRQGDKLLFRAKVSPTS